MAQHTIGQTPVGHVAAAAQPKAVNLTTTAAKPTEAAAATPMPAVAADAAVVKPTHSASSVSLPPSPGGSGSVEAAKVKGTHFKSIGDPHETTGDGLNFDNMKPGDFVKLRAKTGDFELQTRHAPWDQNPQAMVNTAAAVKVNGQDDKIAYDATSKQLTFNGKPIEVKGGVPFKIPGGGEVNKTPTGYAITSAKGDKVDIIDRGSYIDVQGEVSAERRDGDVTGSLGAIDSDTDTGNDLVGRDGKLLKDTNALIEDWQVKGDESLFGAPAPGQPLPDDDHVVEPLPPVINDLDPAGKGPAPVVPLNDRIEAAPAAVGPALPAGANDDQMRAILALLERLMEALQAQKA